MQRLGASSPARPGLLRRWLRRRIASWEDRARLHSLSRHGLNDLCLHQDQVHVWLGEVSGREAFRLGQAGR